MTLPAFIEQGRGDTAVVLLHGIGGGAAIWGDEASGTARAIADAGYRAIAVDLPGYGASMPLGPPDMDRLVAALQSLIDHLRAERIVLVGHSMGGMVAQEWLARRAVTDAVARRRPPLDALVLACTSAAFGRSDGDWQARFVAERLAPLDEGLGMAGVAARLVPGMVSPRAAPAAVRVATDIMARVPDASYRAALQSVVAFDRRAELGSIAVSTLVLAGEHDRTAPPALMQRLATRITGAEYVCLDGAGHIANVEQPAAFNAAVVSFLQRHVPAAQDRPGPRQETRACTSPATPSS